MIYRLLNVKIQNITLTHFNVFEHLKIFPTFGNGFLLSKNCQFQGMIYADIILEYSFAGHIVSLHVEHHM